MSYSLPRTRWQRRRPSHPKDNIRNHGDEARPLSSAQLQTLGSAYHHVDLTVADRERTSLSRHLRTMVWVP
jgi:hypothetical protein